MGWVIYAWMSPPDLYYRVAVITALSVLPCCCLFWGKLQPLRRRINVTLLVLVPLTYIILAWLFFNYGGMQVTFHNGRVIMGSLIVTYFEFWFSVIALTLVSFFLYGLCFAFGYDMRDSAPPLQLIGKKSSSSGTSPGIFDTLSAFIIFDQIFHHDGSSHHDHSLGSYGADHNDDGSYNPGAWRKDYDRPPRP